MVIIPSYTGKTFVVEDNDTRIRLDDLTTFAKYKAGDVIPAGKQIGDFKTVPRRTEVRVTKTATDANRNVFAFVEAKTPQPEIPSGWTKAMNLEGRFLNELIGFKPAVWDVAPQGDNFTVTDATALIRGGAPNFPSTGQSIALGSYVVVTSRSGATVPRGKYVKVRQAFAADGQLTLGAEIGWTAASNLTEGCAQAFLEAAWKNPKGDNGCWQKGQFIGAKVLVEIVGMGGEAEQITLASLESYLKLKDAAAAKNLTLGIESAFRTFARQEQLFKLFQAGQGNLAAKPGASNHQHGQAFDLNTRGFDTPLYLWLTKNGPKLGFIRTVSKEHWHWEYRPAEAAQLAAQGKFKLPGVSP
jgi:hypothetical protein